MFDMALFAAQESISTNDTIVLVAVIAAGAFMFWVLFK
jgi:hypothetical protein